LEELTGTIGDFIRDHGFWAGPIVGLITFGESLVLVGLFIPATAVLMVVGGLIGAGVLDPAPILLGAVIGAALGDWVSYLLGRKIGPSVYRRWPLTRYRALIARSRLFFRRFGFASIFIGRFFGPIRATIPLVAGVMRMDQRRFQLANVTSATVWVPTLLAPGYFATTTFATLNLASEATWAGLIALIVLLSMGGSWLGYRILRSNAEKMKTRQKMKHRAGLARARSS
jgi:membrane protein DedA with SNARE-associated domain